MRAVWVVAIVVLGAGGLVTLGLWTLHWLGGRPPRAGRRRRGRRRQRK